MPDLFIITGANGAGKSSVGPTYLPDVIRNYCAVFDGRLSYSIPGSELPNWFVKYFPLLSEKIMKDY